MGQGYYRLGIAGFATFSPYKQGRDTLMPPMRRFSLLYKVIIAYLVILLPVFVVINQIFENDRAEMEKLLVSELTQTVDEREAYILMYMQMNKNRMHDFASDGFIVGTLDQMQGERAGRVLSEYMRKYK